MPSLLQNEIREEIALLETEQRRDVSRGFSHDVILTGSSIVRPSSPSQRALGEYQKIQPALGARDQNLLDITRLSTRISELARDSQLAESKTPSRGVATDVHHSPQTTKMQDSSLSRLATEPLAQPQGQAPALSRVSTLEASGMELSNPNETPLIFDIPVTYNDKVRNWIRFFQSEGRSTYKSWLQRSSRFLPIVQSELASAGLPQDLAYVAMIESGFMPGASSHAGAKGMWQFIPPTAKRYGLKIDWWIDERKDFHKATQAAIQYMNDLYRQFNSWYLVAASYNMGENGVRRLIERHQTNNFWELAARGVLPQETTDYVPKIIAAMLIAKAPGLYGFRDLDFQLPLGFESMVVPGGTDIINLAAFLGVSERYMKDLNPELTKGFVPSTVRSHKIRVPKGSGLAVSQFVRLQVRDINRTAAN